METTAAQGSQRNPPGSNNITTTIESRSQQTLPAVRTYKSITRGKTRYSSSKPKGKLEQKLKLHSNCLHAKSSQYDNDSRYLDSLSVSGFATASTSNLETKLQYSKQHKSYLTCLCQNQLFKLKSRQNMTATHKRLFRFTFHQTVSITYTVQVLSNDSPHVANCSKLQFHTNP